MKDEVEEQNVAKVMKKVSNETSRREFTELDTEKLPLNSKKPRNRWSKRLFYITGLTTVLLLVILALERNGVSEEDRILMEKLSGKLSYLEMIRADHTLYNAVKHDLLQDLDITATDGDYSLSIDGLIADGSRAVFMYTLTAPNQASRKDSFLSYEILDGNKEHLSTFSHASLLTVYDKESTNKMLTDVGLLDISWFAGGVTPDAFVLNIEVDDKQFHMSIPNDQNRYANMRKTYQADQTLSIGDQQLTVHEAVMTPLAAYVRITADPLNTRNINGMISLALMNEQGKHYPSRGGIGDIMSPEGFNAQFVSSFFDDSSTVYLVSEGAYISDKDKKLVINTDTKETLFAPSDQTTLSEVIVKDKAIDITIQTKDIDVPDPNGYRQFMLLDRSVAFTDATGTEFMILDDSRAGSSFDEEKAEQMSYYSIPKEDYKQPLTFQVHEYPGFVKEKVKILLDLKNSK